MPAPSYAVFADRVQKHPAPTAPDVNQRVITTKHEFAGNVVVLVALGLIE